MLLSCLLMAMQATPQVDLPATPDPQHNLRVDMKFDGAFWAAADANGDGTLDMQEFESEMERRFDQAIVGNPAAQEKITAEKRALMRQKMIEPLFRSLDVNSDGTLTQAEVKSFSSSKAADSR